MPSLKPTLIAIWLPFAAGTGAIAADADGSTAADTAAANSTPAAAAATAGAKDQGPALEEIVVTGLRASLEKSLDIKKNATVVLDSINAEELGRFPDADVADSLEHLPGITISRTTGGEGQKVSVRGFGPQYNIVTLNNRILATDDDARDLAFDVLPSEVISGADVLKSSEASALEGSIGGTVNLRTASPFDNMGFHGGAHAEGNYNQMSSLHGYKFSAFASDTLLDNTLGFLIVGRAVRHSHAYRCAERLQPGHLRCERLPLRGFQLTPPAGTPIAAAPCCITFGSIFDEKKREALSGSLEWRPNDALKLVADGLWTKLQDPQIGYNQSYYFPYGVDQNGNGTWSDSSATIKNGVVTGVTSSNFTPEIVNNTINRNVVTTMYGLKGTWTPTDKFSLGFDAYRSDSQSARGRHRHVRDRGLGLESVICPGLHHGHRPAAQSAESQRDGSAQPARPHGVPERHRERHQSRLLLVYGADELRLPQQQQILVHALRRPQRLLRA